MIVDPSTLTEEDVALTELLARAIKYARSSATEDVRVLAESFPIALLPKDQKAPVTIPTVSNHFARFCISQQVSALPADWESVIKQRFGEAYIRQAQFYGNDLSEALSSTGAAYADLCNGEGTTAQARAGQ